MALPDILKDGYVTIAMGNGATPTEVFTAICGLTQRTFTHQVNTADRFIRDCTDPEDVPIRRLQLTGEQWQLSGSGLLARESLEAVQAAVKVTKNYRFILGEPATDEVYGGHYQGPAVLTSLTIGATEGEFVSVEMTFASDGAWTFTEV